MANVGSRVAEHLEDALSSWAAPQRNALSAPPLICKSYMKLAIRLGLVEPALSCAATLAQFDQEALWRTLLESSVEDIGTWADIDLIRTAATRSLAWRKRQGGIWPVASLLVVHLASQPTCRSHLNFVRATWRDAELWLHSPELRRRITGIAYQLAERNCHSEDDWQRAEEAITIWRRSGVLAALGLPPICPSNESNPLPVHWPDDPEAAGLTHLTPSGRVALSDVLASTDELAELTTRHAVPGLALVDILGMAVARIDFDGRLPEASAQDALADLASGVSRFLPEINAERKRQVTQAVLELRLTAHME